MAQLKHFSKTFQAVCITRALLVLWFGIKAGRRCKNQLCSPRGVIARHFQTVAKHKSGGNWRKTVLPVAALGFWRPRGRASFPCDGKIVEENYLAFCQTNLSNLLLSVLVWQQGNPPLPRTIIIFRQPRTEWRFGQILRSYFSGKRLYVPFR